MPRGRGRWCSGDKQRLQQVLTNLVANAVKFTLPTGSVVLRARSAGGWCEVSVLDDGPGIPSEILPTLFQRYTRAPNGRRTRAARAWGC